jgi:carbohydrate kinase (thermoresistant glucokinase family)
MLILVMGVTGTGKSTLAKHLAERLGLPYFDADDFHPASNKQKMAANVPLTDEDRQPWLERLAAEAESWERQGGAVLACSALKQRYRALLFSRVEQGRVVYLDVERAELERRLQVRRGSHEFIGSFDRILEGQFRDLEPPENAIVVPGRLDHDAGVELVVQELQRADLAPR